MLVRPRTAGRLASRAAASVAAFGLATAAHAQYTKTDPPKERFRVGPLQFTPKLDLLNAGRDSNVFLQPTDPVTDTSVVVRGSAEGFVPVRKRLRFFGDGWLDWSYFRLYTTERSTDPGGAGRVELDVSRFTLIGGGGGFQTRQLIGIDIDQRTLHQQKWGYAGTQLVVSRRASLAGGVEARSYRYDGRATTAGGSFRTAALLNRNTTTAHLEGRYGLTPLTTVVASSDIIDDEFAVAQPELRTTRSYRHLAGFEFGKKALLVGRVMAGIRNFPKSSAGSLPSYRGPAYNAAVVVPVRGSGRLIGSLLRDVFVSASSTQLGGALVRNSYVLTSLRGSVEYGLPLDFVGRATTGFDDVKYLYPFDASGRPIPRQDHIYSLGGTLLRSLSDSLSLGGAATYSRRVSTYPGVSYDRWIVGISGEFAP